MFSRISWALGALLAAGTVACSDGAETASDEAGDTSAMQNPGADSFPAEMLPEELAPTLPLIAPESDGDIPLFSSVVEVGPGEDETFCTYTDVILEEDTLFGTSFGAQSTHGHHAILQYTETPREPGTRVCGDDDMESRMLLGGTGGKTVGDDDYAPENVGVKVPAGSQIVINHHYINTSTEVADVQSMMLARTMEETADTILAGTMNVVGIGWELAPNARTEHTTECTFEEEISYFMALGHMHEWGTHVTIEVDRAGGETETILDHPWTAEDATGDATTARYTLDDPLTIGVGDTVRLTCEWENDTNEAIGWPREMCIFFGYTVAGADYICGNGFWLTPEEAAEAAKNVDYTML